MLTVQITYSSQTWEYEHDKGILELGRGPQRQHQRLILQDPSVSRDQLQINELLDGRIRIRNLSSNQEIQLADAGTITVGQAREHSLPVRMSVGDTEVEIRTARAAVEEAGTDDQSFDK